MNPVIRTLVAGLCVASSLYLGACNSRVVTMTVTRPAMLNAAAVGNTMTVGPVAAPNPQYLPAAAEVSANLQGRITNSLNRSIRLVAQGGGIVITGAVLANDYSEVIERNNRSCSRSVQTRNAQGQIEYRSENYPCTDLRRVGTAVSRVQFSITNGQSGQVVFDQIYDNPHRIVTTGIESAYENNPPAYINADQALATARGENVEHFARVILPWQEQVNVQYEDCNGDATCRQGIEQAQANNLAGAEPLFTAVIGQFQAAGAAVPPDQAEKIGEAFYNRGVTRMYLGRYAQAVADLTRAIAIRPDEDEWQNQLTEAQQMSRDEEALRQQGAIANETQNVQRAGTP